MYTSSQVENLFNRSHETIRQWAKEFAEYLSPTANPEQRRARQYSDADLEVFALIAEMKKQGRLFTDIRAALGAGQRGDMPEVNAIVPTERGKLAVLQRQIGELQAELQARHDEVTRLKALLERSDQQRAEDRAEAKAEIRALYDEIAQLKATINKS